MMLPTIPFDKLRANGINQSFLNKSFAFFACFASKIKINQDTYTILGLFKYDQGFMPTPLFKSCNANMNSPMINSMIMINAVVSSISVTPSSP